MLYRSPFVVQCSSVSHIDLPPQSVHLIMLEILSRVLTLQRRAREFAVYTLHFSTLSRGCEVHNILKEFNGYWLICCLNITTCQREQLFVGIIVGRAFRTWPTVVQDRRFGPTIGNHLHCKKLLKQLTIGGHHGNYFNRFRLCSFHCQVFLPTISPPYPEQF